MSWDVRSRTVALDGGTTNTRARLVINGEILATSRRQVGVRDTVFGGGVSGLEAAVRAAILDVTGSAAGGGGPPDAIVACGMLTSDVGIHAVPHVAAPAGIVELALGCVSQAIPSVSEVPILFVPGVRILPAEGPEGWTRADLMRGEECETFGALALLDRVGPLAMLWPGSHTKLVGVDQENRIVASHTTIAGEMLSAIAQHTLIAASLPKELPDRPDPEALRRGAWAVKRHGLGRAAFLVRLASQFGAMDPAERAAFWMGAVAAEDAEWLARHPMLEAGTPLYVGGRQPLRSIYALEFSRRRDGPVIELEDGVVEASSARGALRIAQARWDRQVR